MDDKRQKKLFTVAELAEFGDVSTQTIRYYHQEKLLVPTMRTENGYRKYDHNQIYKLIKICYLRKMNFNIKEIQQFLSYSTREETVQMLHDHATKLREECNNLLEIVDTISNKTQYVEEQTANLALDDPQIVEEAERYYVSLGNEVLAARHHMFFLYQTLVHYRQVTSPDHYDISFSCLIPAADLPTLHVPYTTIPAGQFVRCYHKGAYSTVAAKVLQLRSQFSQYNLSDTVITLNVVDQFVENQEDNFIVAIEIPILP